MIRIFVIPMLFLLTLNGCGPGLAFLGPAFSYSQSGNVMQSALSYGTNHAFKKIRSKSGLKKQGNAFDDNNTLNKNSLFTEVKKK